MKKLAVDVTDIFGSVSPPPGMNIGGGGDAVDGLGTLIGWGINIFMTVAGMFLLLYLFLGAFDWINSGGEKEKITKAQSRITNALVGIVLVFIIIVVFNVVAGQLLGIVENTPDGFRLKLPKLQPTP